MSTMQTKSLNTPDEIRSLPKTKVEVIDFGDVSLMKEIDLRTWMEMVGACETNGRYS